MCSASSTPKLPEAAVASGHNTQFQAVNPEHDFFVFNPQHLRMDPLPTTEPQRVEDQLAPSQEFGSDILLLASLKASQDISVSLVEQMSKSLIVYLESNL